ncbi:hypothetical protein P7K49_032601 [Saguinus oedipus]|uniref:Uncharacterized protein n=1 Tax=Saguinus oedipus TaxID=9490 RepID=A0ABQ9TZM3_SAGOE|nr:hypothetical protein P7K49_032601 [Saguinus oedipus]
MELPPVTQGAQGHTAADGHVWPELSASKGAPGTSSVRSALCFGYRWEFALVFCLERSYLAFLTGVGQSSLPMVTESGSCLVCHVKGNAKGFLAQQKEAAENSPEIAGSITHGLLSCHPTTMKAGGMGSQELLGFSMVISGLHCG